MAVRFILGRSGTGKTHHCIKAVADALAEPSRQPLILLVPEQATYQAERAILNDPRIVGYNRLAVLSFDRLRFLLLRRRTARPPLSRIARQMIIHGILRAGKSELKLFGQAVGRPGLAHQMAETIAELHEYAKTPDDLARLLEELSRDDRNAVTALKFRDIAMVLERYLQFIDGRLLDPQVELDTTCRAAADADFVKGARLWVDGFAGFTSAELALLAELLKAAEQSYIALCLDPSAFDLADPLSAEPEPGDLFYPTRRTYAQLLSSVRQLRLPLAEPILLDEPARFRAAPQLAHIERSASQDDPPRVSAAGSVRVISAPNERAEVRFVAEEILKLVRHQDCRYRDIAVIASDIERYRHYIEAYFRDYALPFFIDRRRPMSNHPVVALICSALKAVTGGLASSDIFDYLKTDLVPLEPGDIDLLENYCVAFGIRGPDWCSDRPWRFAGPEDDFDEQRIDRIRRTAVRPLLQLKDKLGLEKQPREPIDAADFTRAVFDLLETLDVRETLADWAARAPMQADDSPLDEHRQLYGRLVDLFDELCDVFETTPMTAEDYLAVISSAFEQMMLAFIPPRLDQVLVGSIERSRHPALKVVFLIGATQKQFPVPLSPSGLLADEDRAAAEAADFALAPGADRVLAERRYLCYIAFTRPSQRLYVTYPAVDEKGSAVSPSQFVAELQERFEDLATESIAAGPGDIETITTQAALVELLCTHLGKDPPGTGPCPDIDPAGLLEAIRGQDRFQAAARTVLAALEYRNRAELDPGIVAELFGSRLYSSATRLRSFAQCPYRHFARYVLGLRQRKEFKFEPLDLGGFYHKVLDGWLKQLKAQGQSLADAPDERLVDVVRQQVRLLVETDAFVSNFASHSPHNAFIIHDAAAVLEECVLAIAEMTRAGGFEPAFSELSFGEPNQGRTSLGTLEIALDDGRVLSLSGKIDRLDVANIDGKETAIIFDYKRRPSSFRFQELYHGLDMQLPIYMLAARADSTDSKTDRDLVGAFYMPVEAPPAPIEIDELPARAQKFTHKAHGIFNAACAGHLDRAASQYSRFYNFFVTTDGRPYGRYQSTGALKPADFRKLLAFTRTKLARLAAEIFSGRIDVAPYRTGTKSPCSLCEFKALCRFDWQINEYNWLEPLSKTEVLKRMGDIDG